MSRRKLLITVPVLLLLAVATFVGWRMFGPAPAGTDFARTRQTEKSLYAISIAPENEAFDRSVMHSWFVTVTTPDGKPVTGAKFNISGGMPRHGHGLPTEPQVTKDFGDGRYLLEGVKFTMFGWWEFGFDIDAGQGKDRVVFNLNL